MMVGLADQAYISGTTLAQFVSATYSCATGVKHVLSLYGVRQNARELTDRPESTERCEVVIVGASSLDSITGLPGLSKIGHLTICEAPVHKLSYLDTQRVTTESTAGVVDGQILLHFTKVASSDGIVRVFYTLYDCGGNSSSSPRTLKLKVDNLVDSLQGFTKIANVFTRNSSSSFSSLSPKKVEVKGNDMFKTDDFRDLDALASEKAALVKRIVELSNKLHEQAQQS
jgi:hypothetical protein